MVEGDNVEEGEGNDVEKEKGKKTAGGLSLFSLANGGLAILLQLRILGWEFNLGLDLKICWNSSGCFFIFRCMRIWGSEPGLRISWLVLEPMNNNNNNIKSFYFSHYSNNIVGSTSERLVVLCFFFTSKFSWKGMALLAFLFLSHQNNNNTIIFIFHHSHLHILSLPASVALHYRQDVGIKIIIIIK